MSSHDLDPRLRESTSTSNKTKGQITPVAQAQYLQELSPTQSAYSNTPQNATNTHHSDHDQPGSSTDTKRPRACESCRGLKVRCEFDVSPTGELIKGPCKRCRKATRTCVITEPSRKRQKKADSRVEELEKKIDALRASLQATQSSSISVSHAVDAGNVGVEQERDQMHGSQNTYQQVTNGRHGINPIPGQPESRMSNEWSTYSRASEFDTSKPSLPPMVVAGQKRKLSDIRDHSGTPDNRSPSVSGPSSGGNLSSQRSGNLLPTWLTSTTTKPTQTHEYADVIDRGLVTSEMAANMFNCYVEKMAPHMPSVVFPPGTSAADIRKSKPTLFLAILGASSGMNYPQLQRVLTKEVMSIYADRIICNGEKTLEIIQALNVSTLWYWPPEHFEELKFYQLIHTAAVMAIDIGMGKRSKSSKGKDVGLWRDHPWRRTPYPDPESIEARRAWLSCYFLCCNASMGLRRPNLIRWTPFMADSIDVLENSPEAAQSDKVLCQWVRSQHIAEEIGTQFSMDDPLANVNITDAKVQYALKGFERDLEKWRNHVPADVQSPALRTTEHVVNLYMHEIALHVDHNVDEFKPPFTEDTLRSIGQDSDSLTPAHIDALSTCLTAIKGIFDTFLKFDVETIRCLPVLHFVRVAYAIVVLIKMYFAAASPKGELGKVINKDDMKVQQYLDGLVEKFRASSAEEKSRPSAKFLMVLLMLKTWFHRQQEGKAPPSNTTETSTAITIPTIRKDPKVADSSKEANPSSTHQGMQSRNGQPGGYNPSNTPLQLLSEVATGTSAAPRPDNISNYANPPADWSQQPQYAYDPSMNQSYGAMGTHIDPSLGMELNYMIGDGFEQAMGMTLGGVADLSSYFTDDTFFGSLMDPAAGGSGYGY